MCKLIRYTLRFMAIVTMLILIPLAFGPGKPTNTPYPSALSDLVLEPAFAAPCPRTACYDIAGDGKKPTCRHTSLRLSCVISSGCITPGIPC